jgi:hypothetical protein
MQDFLSQLFKYEITAWRQVKCGMKINNINIFIYITVCAKNYKYGNGTNISGYVKQI